MAERLKGIAKSREGVAWAEIEDDVEAEKESMEAAEDIDDELARDPSYLRESPPASRKKAKMDMGNLAKNIEKASEHVVVPGTAHEYRNLWKAITEFCVEYGFIEERQKEDHFWKTLPSETPVWVTAWIMSKADDIDLVTGELKDLNIERVSYARAQKMRAAVSHKFGRGFKIGTQMWCENPNLPGTFYGNPSLSVVVSEYMISLRRRKVRSGSEVVTSARAMDHLTMKELYYFNQNYPQTSETRPLKRKGDHGTEWGGYKTRVMMTASYTISMKCLLRFDETLRILWTDIDFIEVNGHNCVRLKLPFRKTHQLGEIYPFLLYEDLDRPWMCPVAALAEWWLLCHQMGVEQSGFVFRSHCHGSDEVSAFANARMSTKNFLQCFRNNLIDIGVDPRSYGTHSFRRGGCQFLHTELRWDFRKICDWGGWAEDFDHPTTIFKYLLSWVDKPAQREDYFNPDREVLAPCSKCGRTCPCF